MAFVQVALPPLGLSLSIRPQVVLIAPLSHASSSTLRRLRTSANSFVSCTVKTISPKLPNPRTYALKHTLASGGNGGRSNHGRRRFRNDGDSNGGKGEDENELLAQSSLLAYTAYLVSRRRSPHPLQQPRYGNAPPQSFSNLLKQLRVCHIILAINVAIFMYQAFLAPSLLMAGAKVNSAIAAGEYYRLISPMFLHASTTHLLVNSFSLNSTGPSVESWFGKKRFLALYIVSGLCGNLLSYMCSPTPSVGASGAIFGLVGASAVLLSRHRKLLGPRARRGLQSLLYIVAMNFGMGLTPGSQIDNFGHLGGFLGGIAYSYIAGPRLVVRRSGNGRPMASDEPVALLVLRDIRFRLRQLRRFLLKAD